MALANARGAVTAALLATVAVSTGKLVLLPQSVHATVLASTVHSLVDGCCLALILYGITRATGGTFDEPVHVRGTLRFWCLLAPVALYAMGAGIALREGVGRMAIPTIEEGSRNAQIVLSAGTLVSVVMCVFVLRAVTSLRAAGLGSAVLLRRSSNVPWLALAAVSLVGLMGHVVALLGLFASSYAGKSIFDPLAAIGVGLILAGLAAFMTLEARRVLFEWEAAAVGGGVAPNASATQPADRAATVEIVTPAASGAATGQAEVPRSAAPQQTPPLPSAATSSQAKHQPETPGKPHVTMRQGARKGRGKRR